MIENMLIPHISPGFAESERYRQGQVKIVNPLPVTPVLGLHIPDMKKIAKELVRTDGFRDMLDGFEAQKSLYYEEKVVWGLMLDYAAMPQEERLSRFSAFVPAIDGWAVCDTVCGAAKWADVQPVTAEARRAGCTAEAYRTEARRKIWSFLQKWWRSDREFEVRFAVIMSMSYFLDEKWLPQIFERTDALDFSRVESAYLPYMSKAAPARDAAPAASDALVKSGLGYVLPEGRSGRAPGAAPYYLRMGVAWMLATALAKFPDATREYVRRCRLPEDVLKLYVRKARESFRTRTVSPF